MIMLALARAFAHFRTLTKLTVQAQYRNLLIQAEVAELRNRVSSATKHPKVHPPKIHPHKMKTPKHTLVHPKIHLKQPKHPNTFIAPKTVSLAHTC